MKLLDKIKTYFTKYYLNNYLRQSWIHARQKKALSKINSKGDRRVVVFLSPGYDNVSGGIMSIVSIYEESRKILPANETDIFVCTHITDPKLYRYTKFDNTVKLHSLFKVLDHYVQSCEILIHMPEIYVDSFARDYLPILDEYDHQFVFNILLQNYDLVPRREAIAAIQQVGRVSITTAHKAYSGKQTEKKLGCKVYHLSVWIDPLSYHSVPFEAKDNLILLSPDMINKFSEFRDGIINELRDNLPDYQFDTIKNLTYSEYKKRISRAKFTLSFGEGLDGYYIESIFSGGIGCAVFNETYFTSDFEGAPFLYSTWDELVARLPVDIKSAENKVRYDEATDTLNCLLSNHYSITSYRANIINFYKSIGWC